MLPRIALILANIGFIRLFVLLDVEKYISTQIFFLIIFLFEKEWVYVWHFQRNALAIKEVLPMLDIRGNLTSPSQED
jgi:hypothetical protein